MSLSEVGHGNGHPFVAGAHPGRGGVENGVVEDGAREEPAATPAGPNPQDPVPADDAVRNTDEGEASSQGVLRLLESGHFKGVADVRLRINFFDELSAGAVKAALPLVEDGLSNLSDIVNAQIDELLATAEADDETGDLIAGLRVEFDAAIQAAAETFASDGVFDPDAVQSAFDALGDQLRQLLTAPVPGPEAASDETGTPQDGPVADPVSALDEALAALADAFGESLSALVSSISTASQLPDPSSPSGHGVAYAKFLAIYNELRGLEPSTEPPSQEGPIDATG